MKISEERKSNLHSAISGNIMDLRIMVERAKSANTEIPIDQLLFDLETDIWKEVVDVLGIEI